MARLLMRKLGDITIRIPNSHQTDIGGELLGRILHQAGIVSNKLRKSRDVS